MSAKAERDQPFQFSEKETARRRDQALLRALSMPPKPHAKPKQKAKRGAPKK